MAKKGLLKDRNNNTAVYPVTTTNCVLNKDGSSIPNIIAVTEDSLPPEGSRDENTLYLII